jgi:hypothetical protein
LKAHPDFVEFVTALNNNHVEYVIVGAYALAYHGHPRATGDMDFWIKPTVENAKFLLNALTEFGFGKSDISKEDVLSGKISRVSPGSYRSHNNP